jgi:hypothetical protein
MRPVSAPSPAVLLGSGWGVCVPDDPDGAAPGVDGPSRSDEAVADG